MFTRRYAQHDCFFLFTHWLCRHVSRCHDKCYSKPSGCNSRMPKCLLPSTNWLQQTDHREQVWRVALSFSMRLNTGTWRIGFVRSWSPVVPHVATCWAWQARHLVHAPLLLIYSAISAGLRAPKATAGFMNGVRPQRRQCVQRYIFLVGCKLEVVCDLWFSRRLISSSTSSSSSSPRNFCSRT